MKSGRPFIILSLPLLAATLFFGSFSAEGKEPTMDVSFEITSPVFEHHGSIPAKYTCDGSDINPPLRIQGAPAGAKSLAIIVDDPDAPRGMWVHWIAWNIDPNTAEIREDSVPKGAVQGVNDFRRHTYGGPCPPSGTHRYFFKVYALDVLLNLGVNSEKEDLVNAMKGHILAEALIIGTYQRK